MSSLKSGTYSFLASELLIAVDIRVSKALEEPAAVKLVLAFEVFDVAHRCPAHRPQVRIGGCRNRSESVISLVV